MTIVDETDFVKRIHKLSEKSYKPGERRYLNEMDSHDLRYLESGVFCANLHVHTHYSDGKMKVSDVINKTKEIPNMFCAITDHDTLEGAKEAYNINDKDADICLGVEISTIATKFPKQPKPIPIHLLVYCIDPFDEKLNNFLKEKSRLKLKLAKSTIDKLNDALPDYNFSLEEAAKCHPMILKGQDEIAHPMKKYTACKILFEHYAPDANFSYEYPFFKHKYMFKGFESFYVTYKKALSKCLEKELPLIPDKIFDDIETAKEIYTASHPTLKKMPDAFASFEETVEFVSNLNHGIMSIAHPMRIKAYVPEFYNYLFYDFKNFGKEKAMCYEKYYQSYDGYYYIEWKDIVNRAAGGLIPTGGLDTHGTELYERGAYY